MSQVYKSALSGPIPPTIPTEFETQNGTAFPAANVLIINGKDSTENNDNGIIAKGGAVGTGTANKVDIVITNRATGQTSTNDATPVTIITFDLSLLGAGVYYFKGSIVGFNTTDVAGGAYDFSTGARTTGLAGTELGTEYKDVFEEANMSAADFTVSVSANNLVVQVIGIAAKAIDWNAEITYRFVG